MKKVLVISLFKCITAMMILYLLLIGYQYIMWHQLKSGQESEIIPANSGPRPNSTLEKTLGIQYHFQPDFWPFDSPK
jgi:hypothetical protein